MSDQLETFLSKTDYFKPFWLKKLSFIHKQIIDYCSANNKQPRDLRVLDVGCGVGGITFPIASLGCIVVAFDLDEEKISKVKARIKAEKLENVIVTVDNGYVFDDGRKYDVAIASEVFEHLTEPHILADSIHEKLVPGGLLVVTTPNGWGAWELQTRFVPYRVRRWPPLRFVLGMPSLPIVMPPGSYHVQFYTRGRLQKMFHDAGYREMGFEKISSLLGAFMPLYLKSDSLERVDLRMAEMLPYWVANNWCFAYQKI